jgi:hypothetical protein
MSTLAQYFALGPLFAICHFGLWARKLWRSQPLHCSASTEPHTVIIALNRKIPERLREQPIGVVIHFLSIWGEI